MSETSKFSFGRTLLLLVWGAFCVLPIIFFATIALRHLDRDLGEDLGRMAHRPLLPEFGDRRFG
jgi:hypothetical protein